MLSLRLSILGLLCLMILFPTITTSGSTIIQSDRSAELNVSEDINAVSAIDEKGSIKSGSTSEDLVEVTNNLQNEVTQEVNLENGIGWNLLSSSQRNVSSGNSEVYRVDTTSVSSSTNNGNYTVIARNGSFDLSSQRQVQIIEPSVTLDAKPNTVDTSSTHTWKLPDYVTPLNSSGNKTGIDSFLIDYSGSDADFSGLTDSNITVTLTRQLSSGPDRSTINVNSDSYSGQQALIDLSGFSNTKVVDDSGAPNVKVEIQGIQNPTSKGSYSPTITLNLDQGAPSNSFTAELSASADSFFLSEITSVPQNITEGGTINTDYNVTNTGQGQDTQDIVFNVNNNEESRDNSVTLSQSQSKTGTFSYTDNDESIRADVSVQTNNDTAIRTIQIVDKFKLNASPNTVGSTSNHTWEASNSTIGGDVDTITVDYPSGSGFSFDGLNDDNITVKIVNQGESSPSDISVNSGTYSGSTATFDLSGVFNTDVDGKVLVKIEDIDNAGSSGTYQPTITLDNGTTTVSDTAELEIQ